MNTHLKLFARIALFLGGTYSSIGQDDVKTQEEYAIKKKQYAEAQKAEAQNVELKKAAMTPEVIAKKQTLHLQQLLDLDEKQTVRVHEICSYIEYEMSTIPANIEVEKRMKLINDLETVKNEKLKETLTADQYTIYQNSFDKRK